MIGAACSEGSTLKTSASVVGILVSNPFVVIVVAPLCQRVNANAEQMGHSARIRASPAKGIGVTTTEKPKGGQAVVDLIVPPKGNVVAQLKKGERLRVTDIEGGQVGDIIAYADAGLRERFWVSNTIRLNGRIFLQEGDVLYSELSRPMLRIVSSTCDRHDLLAGSCNAEIDRVRYGVDEHYGCVENFLAALKPWNAKREDVPMSFNIFMNCPVGPNGEWEIVPPISKAGDFIEFVAEMDVLVVMSNCPQDLNPCNDGRLKPLGWKVFEAE